MSNSKVWIALDREVAESVGICENVHDGIYGRNKDAIEEACRKSLVTECVEVGGDVQVVGPSVKSTTQFAPYGNLATEGLPADFPTGPCRVIVIAGERDG